MPVGARAGGAAAGQSCFAAQRRVEYIVGDTPVIISAPHGGRLSPASIPDRTYGTLPSDLNTDRLARDIAQAFHRQTGKHAHVIICHLKRKKVDCNRDIEEGAQGNFQAEETWRAFHAFTGTAQASVKRAYGKGLYLDIHGHGREEAWIMLGYLLTNRQLHGDVKDLTGLAKRSSIRHLVDDSGTPFVELLRGETSFGSLLQQRGYAAVPSPAHPHAGKAGFLSGGYNTRRYGSRDGGTISGFQIECQKMGIRDTDANRKAFARAFADATIQYLRRHFDIDFSRPSGSLETRE